MALYAIIRLRGTADVRPEIEHTLRLLRLHRRFTASIYHDSLPGLGGMLKVAEPWITWGEIDVATLSQLIAKRGRLVGDKPISDEWVKQALGFNSIAELAEKLVSGEIHYHKLEPLGVKPFFRLTPPKGGFKGRIKRMVGDHGELGYRGSEINELVLRMI